jgi:hypothetical protein
MSRPTNQQQPLSLDSQVDEDRIRRALGLNTNGTHQQRPEQARQRHRFVSDGSVPVVVLNRAERDSGGLKEKLEAAEAALEAERNAHAATRRALQEAQMQAQALETRLGHATLAHNEAITAEREARRVAEEALASVRTEISEQPTPRASAESKQVVRKMRVPRAPKAEKEQKPVRWWTPSYRAKHKKR